ncbi:MAG: hypothetical protein FJ297_15430 [Planctomycetes bacterium]|nr:hypothetical protein [Planctomycetota bacterium]
MSRPILDHQLEGYLDESLSADELTAIEGRLRADPALMDRLLAIIRRRDAGIHTLSEIWRRHRLSCPGREQLGSYLLGAMDDSDQAYVRFHIETVGCRYCMANLEDLREAARREEASRTVERRRRYFESSAGYLRRRPD